MRKLARKAVNMLAVSMLIVSAGMGIAHAAESSKRGECKKAGDTFYGTVYYTTQSGGAWVSHISFGIQDNREVKNNVYLRLRGDGGKTTFWAWTSGDDIHGEQPNTTVVDAFVPRSANPYVKFHVIFDQAGPDPDCQFYVNLY